MSTENLSQLLEGEDGATEAVVRSLNWWRAPSIGKFWFQTSRPGTPLVTCKKLLGLGSEVIPHPPYSPDLEPSDYPLFRSLQNHLNRKTSDSNEIVKSELIHFFASQNQTFYKSWIMKLTERWPKVIEQNDEYIID